MLSPQASANKSKDLLVSLLFVIMVAGVGTCIGLTFRPTGALKKDQQADASDADAVRCKSCALDPVKLYSWSFGWSIGGGLILLVVGWVYVNWKLNKHKAVVGNAYAALGGTDTLTGSVAQGMYDRDDAVGNRWGQINQAQSQPTFNAMHNQQTDQMLQQQHQIGMGQNYNQQQGLLLRSGGRWVTTSRP